jgi:hypothetical protein
MEKVKADGEKKSNNNLPEDFGRKFFRENGFNFLS